MNDATKAFLCPECGARTDVLKEGRTVGMRCTSCNWSVVTTYIPSIEQDTTIYEVHVHSGNPHDERQIKLIAHLTGCNFLQARKFLQEKNSTILRGKAVQVLAAKKELVGANLIVSIEPEFKW